MYLLLLVVFGVVALKLRSVMLGLRQRIEIGEIGQAELRAEIARLRRHAGLDPLPQAPAQFRKSQ